MRVWITVLHTMSGDRVTVRKATTVRSGPLSSGCRDLDHDRSVG